MDGFAFDATDEYPLSIVGDEVFPEDEPPSIDSGEAVRIATGAPLPAAERMPFSSARRQQPRTEPCG